MPLETKTLDRVTLTAGSCPARARIYRLGHDRPVARLTAAAGMTAQYEPDAPVTGIGFYARHTKGATVDLVVGPVKT